MLLCTVLAHWLAEQLKHQTLSSADYCYLLHRWFIKFIMPSEHMVMILFFAFPYLIFSVRFFFLNNPSIPFILFFSQPCDSVKHDSIIFLWLTSTIFGQCLKVIHLRLSEFKKDDWITGVCGVILLVLMPNWSEVPQRCSSSACAFISASRSSSTGKPLTIG